MRKTSVKNTYDASINLVVWECEVLGQTRYTYDLTISPLTEELQRMLVSYKLLIHRGG